MKQLKSLRKYQDFKKMRFKTGLIGAPLSLLFLFIEIDYMFSEINPVTMILFSIFLLFSIACGRNVIEAFAEPKCVCDAKVLDRKDHRRTTQDSFDVGLKSTVFYTYLVEDSNGDKHWVEHIDDYLNNSSRRHKIGEKVIYFKLYKNEYIISWR